MNPDTDLFVPADPADSPDRVVPADVTATYAAGDPDGLTLDELVDFLDVARQSGVPGGAVIRVRSGRRGVVRSLTASGPWSGRLR